MSKCKICNDSVMTVIPFGRMPIANGFLNQISSDEYFHELIAGFCPKCLMVQLEKTVAPEMMFNDNYHFISSTSAAMSQHFSEMAEEIYQTVSSKESPFVVELGCNDGIMLKHLVSKKINHVGIEPSKNVAELARKNGVNVLENFFNQDTAAEITDNYGHADIISGANVMCHIENLNSVFEGVGALLKEDGMLLFQDPYLLDIIKQSSFDQIYDEHVYYFSGLSVSELAKRHNMQLVDMVHQDVHGGSMRFYLKKGNSNEVSESVSEYLSQERALNLHIIDGYKKFKNNVDKICYELKNSLMDIKKAGKRIVGYGATSKSTTLLNYAKIGPDLIDYISDNTPTKINKFTPGVHIPIRSHDIFLDDNHIYTLLLAWNHKREIINKETDYRKRGGKFITYFPEVVIE